jgi:hypothetical protein
MLLPKKSRDFEGLSEVFSGKRGAHWKFSASNSQINSCRQDRTLIRATQNDRVWSVPAGVADSLRLGPKIDGLAAEKARAYKQVYARILAIPESQTNIANRPCPAVDAREPPYP